MLPRSVLNPLTTASRAPAQLPRSMLSLDAGGGTPGAWPGSPSRFAVEQHHAVAAAMPLMLHAPASRRRPTRLQTPAVSHQRIPRRDSEASRALQPHGSTAASSHSALERARTPPARLRDAPLFPLPSRPIAGTLLLTASDGQLSQPRASRPSPIGRRPSREATAPPASVSPLSVAVPRTGSARPTPRLHGFARYG